jgi:hypothetical protein
MKAEKDKTEYEDKEKGENEEMNEKMEKQRNRSTI